MMKAAVLFATLMASAAATEECLCVFDIDRTLTGKQGKAAECPKDKEFPGVRDDAYNGGTLILSDAAQHLSNTFCVKCYMGIVTAGSASGPGSKERDIVLQHLGGVNWTLSDQWSGPSQVTSSLVVLSPDHYKQDSVKGILKWFQAEKKLVIKPADVHFFDDRADNVLPFAGTGFNAHQISCRTRDPNQGGSPVGLCGAQAAEIIAEAGVRTCAPPAPQSCSMSCTQGGQTVSCKERVNWAKDNVKKKDNTPIGTCAAIDLVNRDCAGQCSCKDDDFATHCGPPSVEELII